MLIQINDNIRITSDPNNIIIQKRYEKKPKEGASQIEYGWKDVGYYGKLEHAAQRLLDSLMKESEAVGIKNLLAELERMKDEVVKAVRESGKQ